MAAEAEDFGSWADEIDWDLRYDDGPHAGQVISKLLELGFTITAPPMPPFTVTCNEHPEFRCGSREEAELFLRELKQRGSLLFGYDIREESLNRRAGA
jgi:hypothetical protein